MVAKIKLQRKGTKKKPFYRVVVQADTEAGKSDVVDVLGQYDPLKDPSLFKVDVEKTKAWLAKGVQPTEKARILLGKAGIMEPIDLVALPKRKPRAELKAEAAGEKPAAVPTDKPAAGEKKEEAKAEAKAEEKAVEPVKEPEQKEPVKDENKEKEVKEEVKEPEKA